MEGAPLQPFWEGGHERPAERTAFIEALSSATTESKAVRTERYKYIISFGGEELRAHGRAQVPEHPKTRELYDLRDDPRESLNLLDAPKPPPGPLVRGLDQGLREMASAGKGRSDRARLDPEVVERLRALGYLGN
jgi:hypothetical protein